MTTATALERHRAHHIRVLVLLAGLAPLACSNGLPRPPRARVDVRDYVAVPFSPRTPPPEYVPPRPHPDAVWIDGSWEWRSRRYLWRFGSWVRIPEGVRYAPWAIVRRAPDGQLFFAPSSFRDAAGNKVDDRPFRAALGPGARARARLGDDAHLADDSSSSGGDGADGEDGPGVTGSDYAPEYLQDSGEAAP